MALKDRINLYSKIEKQTGNPLIVYSTSKRTNASGIIAGDVLDEFIKQLEKIKEPVKTIDILVESNGGDGLVVLRLISAIRTKTERIRVLIPYSAFSATTLFCLGAEEIIMGKYGCLGPIDPQITVAGKDGQIRNFAFEDMLAFVSFVKDRLKLEKEGAKDIFNHFFDSVEPSAIGFASRSSSLSKAIGEKLLQSHSDKRYSSKDASKIANKLNKNFFNHGHPLNKEESLKIGLNIINPDEILEKLMWKVHLDLDKEFLTNSPFDFVSNFLQNKKLAPLGNNQIPVGEYEFEIKYSLLESKHLAQEYFIKHETTIFRDQSLIYHPSNVIIKQGWRDAKI